MEPLISGGDCRVFPEITSFHGEDIAGELGILARFATDRKLGAGNGQMRTCHFPAVESDGGNHKGSLGCLELGPDAADVVNQIQLVAAGVRRISILVSLPPDKSSDFITLILVLWEVSREVIQYRMSFSDEIVVLLAGVPVHFLTGIILGP